MKYIDFKLGEGWDIPTKNIFNSFYKEIWEDNEYDRHGILIEAGDIVVDLGASIGIFSQYAISKKASKVYSFECLDEHFKYLLENTKDTKSIVPIYGLISADSDCINFGSCVSNQYKGLSLSRTSYNLENIFTSNKIDYVDFMKVDIEGFEYDFLLNANDVYFNKVKKWAIELHVWGMYRNTADEYIKVMQLIEKFTLNGYKVYCEQIHKNMCLYMLYASK